MYLDKLRYHSVSGLSEAEVQLAFDRAMTSLPSTPPNEVSVPDRHSWGVVFARWAVVAGVMFLAAAFVKVRINYGT